MGETQVPYKYSKAQKIIVGYLIGAVTLNLGFVITRFLNWW